MNPGSHHPGSIEDTQRSGPIEEKLGAWPQTWAKGPTVESSANHKSTQTPLSQAWCCMPMIPALWRIRIQRLTLSLHSSFEASLCLIRPCFKKPEQQTNKLPRDSELFPLLLIPHPRENCPISCPGCPFLLPPPPTGRIHGI